MRWTSLLLRTVLEAAWLPWLVLAALVARVLPHRIDVGLGPQPLINNVYHKRALALAGYSAETFVSHVWHITADFDVRFDTTVLGRNGLLRRLLLTPWIFAWSAARYRALVVYFDGGPLAQGSAFLWRLEPHLYRLAGVRTVVLAYGSDVQALSRSPNLLYKHAFSVDYPQQRGRHVRITGMIDLWTAHGDHVVGGCEWVDYMVHWDTLMVSHFSIALDGAPPPPPAPHDGPLRLLHAPNHREIKGTRHVEQAVRELQAEGLAIELDIVERVPNAEVRRRIAQCDLVVDQLVIGWYAMFSIEAMAAGKPAVCHLRHDLEALYVSAGLLDGFGEIPLLRADVFGFKEVLRAVHADRSLLQAAGARGPAYVQRRHSLEAIALAFTGILVPLLGPPRPR